jgi:hypothetical protein
MEIFPHRFFFSVAKDRFRRRVPESDIAFRIHHEDGILGRIRNATQSLVITALGDVLNDRLFGDASAGVMVDCIDRSQVQRS